MAKVAVIGLIHLLVFGLPAWIVYSNRQNPIVFWLFSLLLGSMVLLYLFLTINILEIDRKSKRKDPLHTHVLRCRKCGGVILKGPRVSKYDPNTFANHRCPSP